MRQPQWLKICARGFTFSPNSPTTPEDQSITVCLCSDLHLLPAQLLFVPPPPANYTVHIFTSVVSTHLGNHGNWRSGLIFKPFEEVQVRTATPGHAFAWPSLTLCESLRRLVFLGEQSGTANQESEGEEKLRVQVC